jgi:predicted alpha/beta-hydrolase family hydrolase
MREGRKRPDPLPMLITAHREALATIRARATGPLVLIGKSMGGRIGCHVANLESVDAVVCFGYPLCGMGDRTKLRDKVLRELATPILFVQGTRDPLCPLDLLESVRKEMKAPSDLHIVDGGDHSLMVRKRELQAAGLTQDAIEEQIAAKVAAFLEANDAAAPRAT